VTDAPDTPTTDEPDEDAPHPLADHPLYVATRIAAEKNLKRTHELAALGVQLDPVAVMDFRFELLVETMLPNDTVERLVFEARFTEQVEHSLDEAEAAVARARLSGTMPPTPAQRRSGLIVPGR
jgi:hypothetical protein